MRAKRAKTIRRAQRIKKTPAPIDPSKKKALAFTRTFLLAAAVAIIPLSLMPETWFGPLNRATAHLSAHVLALLGRHPVVRGTTIAMDGFAVNVIAECSAVHLIALAAAFIFAFPADPKAQWTGVAVGTLLLFTVNGVRIAAVTIIGRHWPQLFTAAHVYLGQLSMILATVALCLVWCQWASRAPWTTRPIGFCLRFLAFSALPFLIWIPLNRIYMGLIDRGIQALFGLFSLQLVMPRTHPLYYQTFSLIALMGLLMAVQGAGLLLRLRWMAAGFFLVTLFQAAFRLCNVWISAFGIAWMTVVAQLVYNLCVYALPVAIAMGFLMQVRARRLKADERQPA